MTSPNLPTCHACGREELPELLELHRHELYCITCHDDLIKTQCCECGDDELPELLQAHHGDLYCQVCYDDMAEKQDELSQAEFYGGTTPTMSDKEYLK